MTADYIIVGGGAAGCILAARLSEDPGVRVVLVEAGAERRTPLLRMPAGEVLLLGRAGYDWNFTTAPDPTIDGRTVGIPRGRLLGGSNAINGMIYVRGQPSDYDGWAALGAAGWGWRDVLPTFVALERWIGPASEARGASGPMRVGPPGHEEPLCETFFRAAEQTGHRRNRDYNSGDIAGVGPAQCTIDRGRRWSVIDGYLSQARARGNLEILTRARALKLLVEEGRCVGVRVRVGTEIRELRAAREVVLAAGTVQSPHLLELSGIGRPEILARAGLPVVHALPGVGEGFRDHFAVRMRWRILRPVTFNERTRGLALLRELARYALGRPGVLSLPIAPAVGFLRSRETEPEPDLQVHFAPATYGGGTTRRLERLPGMTMGIYPLRPESCGSIHAAGPDPLAPPRIAPRFLDSEIDRRRLVDGMRLVRRIVAAPAFDPFRGEELSPGARVASDAELTAFARAHGDTSYHPVGTCRMGAPTDEQAVVDPRLRVRGIEGLRIVDASIMPTMVSGNTQAATMMIAETGARMIREDARESRRGPPRTLAAVA